jgi:hypothetical protein
MNGFLANTDHKQTGHLRLNNGRTAEEGELRQMLDTTQPCQLPNTPPILTVESCNHVADCVIWNMVFSFLL